MMEDTYQIRYWKRPGDNAYRVVVQDMHTYHYVEDMEVYANHDTLDEVLAEMKSKYNPSHLCEVCY